MLLIVVFGIVTVVELVASVALIMLKLNVPLPFMVFL